ncbi:hypothetical protein [Legionella fallonii]|uniref:Uncharacterized protein n=1 Tax=Legionella fallonii LLAP-10 TaxID=1212491 RepID=A0A098GCU3_9GAMM|nr:hypothetical protein [Legionella fallonii]CEG59286.1 exported protein of unknown function [Legionella fallonii LLAP-10]
MMNKPSFKLYALTLISLVLFSTGVYSKNKFTELNELIDISAKIELVKIMLTSNIYPNDSSCALAKKIKDGEQVLLKNYDTKPISHDLMIDLIHLSKEIHEKCVVMSSFNKRILPIIRNGNLSASFEQDYELINVPQFLKVNLVNLQNEQLSQLKQCSIKGSIFIVGHTVVNAVANELQCKINGINVSFRLMSSLSVKNTLSCVKSIEYLPEFIQPCKKLILSKNKKVSLMLASNFDDVTLSHDEISKKIAQEAFGK